MAERVNLKESEITARPRILAHEGAGVGRSLLCVSKNSEKYVLARRGGGLRTRGMHSTKERRARSDASHLPSRAARRSLVYKKNRASQSGGDRRARGIFELSTNVGLRRTSVRACTGAAHRNLVGQIKEQFYCCPKFTLPA